MGSIQWLRCRVLVWSGDASLRISERLLERGARRSAGGWRLAWPASVSVAVRGAAPRRAYASKIPATPQRRRSARVCALPPASSYTCLFRSAFLQRCPAQLKGRQILAKSMGYTILKIIFFFFNSPER